MEIQHHIGEQLDSLLNDSEGVQLFHDFLSTRFSSGHLLDFWFACKGFRSIIDGDDQLKLLQVAKAIYRTYIRTDAASSVPVNESTKREIRSTLTLYSHAHHKNVSCDKKLPVLRSLFDAAQMDIQNKLARSYFLDFLHSDAFRLVRQSLFNPEILANLQSTGLGSSKACTTQSRQKSEKQLVSDSPNQAANRIGDLNETFSAFGHSASHSSASRNFEDPRNVSKPHCADVLQSCRSSSVENSYNAAPLRRPAPAVAGATESANGAEVVTASDLIAFMNATSEIQKPGLIGGGQATSQTAITGANESRKPHTNLAEVDPNAFVQTLSHRLEKVRESRGKMEKLLSRMQPIDAAESTALDSEFSGEKQQHPSQQLEGKDAAVNLPSRSFSREAGGRRRASSSSRFLMTPRASSAAVSGACLRKKLSALVCDDVDDAQVILEDHCSRIWTDEAGEEDLLQLNQSSVEPPTAICPPAALSQRKTHHHRFNPSSHHADVYSISSFDSGVVTCGGLNSSDSESCISRCQNQGTHNRGIYPGGGGGGKYASSSAHKRCFNFPPSTAVPAEDCFGSGGPGCAHNAPWNPALPPPPVCFFCQRPSMNSTPSANRKVPAYQGCWGGTGAYPGPPVYPNQYPEGLQSSRTIRSRSLTSDSPSVFDSGLSSTYDQLPVSRRPRQDASDQQSAETFDSLCTPIPSQMTRVGCPSKEVSDPLRLRDSSFHFPTEKPTINDCGPFISCCINPTGPPFSPGDDNNLPYRSDHKSRTIACEVGQKASETSSVKPTSGGIGPVGLVVGYYLCDDPVPYRTVWTGSVPPQTSTDGGAGDQQSSMDTATSANDKASIGASCADITHPASITLGQFKQLVAKKGVYRYFFKTASDEFGTGVVHEEIGDDNAYLPLWEGKVIARVERAD